MPVCPGDSELQPGSPAVVYVDPQYAASLLAPEIAWLSPYLPFMRPFTLDMESFCALDPPPDVEIDAGDLIGLIGGGSFGLAVLAGEKIAQIVHILMWYRWCRCSDLSTPDAPTYPTAPTGAPILNPPGYVNLPGGAPCRTDVLNLYTATGVLTKSPLHVQVPTGATGYRYTAAIDSANYETFVAITFNDADDGTIDVIGNRVGRNVDNGAYFQYPVASTSNQTPFAALPSANPYTLMYIVQNGGGPSGTPATATVTLEWYCGTNPDDPGTYSPCESCPPDPYLSGQLNRIFQFLTHLQEQVDLIQRQSVPFAYVPGALHEDLTGAGEFAISGLIGARITITATMPGTVGVEAGNPEHLFGAGWVQWGSADGYSGRIWLDQVSTLTFPDAAAAYTLLAYSLPPGVIVDILELEREP